MGKKEQAFPLSYKQSLLSKHNITTLFFQKKVIGKTRKMAKTDFENFYKELNHTIQRQISVTYPIMGIIQNVSTNRQYADVKTEDGIISNIPAHGFPVIGDSCIIHFIKGNLEQPVCDCARRLPPPQDQMKEMLTSDCFNYLPNGDFNQDNKGYTGTYTLITDEEYVTTSNKCCNLQDGQYIEFTCNITRCNTKYFKFQANYKGEGIIRIQAFNNKTGEELKTQPERLHEENILWANNNGRFSWSFNKEVYLKENIEEVKFIITNITGMIDDAHETILINGEKVEAPKAVTLDGLLVYDENGDTSYYWNEEDVILFHNLE